MRLAEYAKSHGLTAAGASAAAEVLGLSATHHLAALSDDDVKALDAYLAAGLANAAKELAQVECESAGSADHAAPSVSVPLIDSILAVLAGRALTPLVRIPGLLLAAGVALPECPAAAQRLVTDTVRRELTRDSASRLVHAAHRLVRVR